jgi:hypothetical protein
MKKIFLLIVILALSFGMTCLFALCSGWLFRYTILNIETLTVIFIPFLFTFAALLALVSLVSLVCVFLCLFESKILLEPKRRGEKPGIFQIKMRNAEDPEIKGAFDENNGIFLN